MVSEFQCKHGEARLCRHTNRACYVNQLEVCISLSHASCLQPMVDGITGLTFLYLARHLALYSFKDNTVALSIFICFVELITVPRVFLTCGPLITSSWLLLL